MNTLGEKETKVVHCEVCGRVGEMTVQKVLGPIPSSSLSLEKPWVFWRGEHPVQTSLVCSEECGKKVAAMEGLRIKQPDLIDELTRLAWDERERYWNYLNPDNGITATTFEASTDAQKGAFRAMVVAVVEAVCAQAEGAAREEAHQWHRKAVDERNEARKLASFALRDGLEESDRLRSESRRLRKLANRRARKCNALLRKLQEARRWHSVTDNDRLIAERERDALKTRLEKAQELWRECRHRVFADERATLDAVLGFDRDVKPENTFYGIDAQQADQDAWKAGRNKPKPTEPKTVTISFEELVGACGATFDPVVQAQLAKCRTCGGNGMSSGKCKACGAGKDKPTYRDIAPQKKFKIFTYDRNTNIIDEESFTGPLGELQSQVEYLCDVARRRDEAGYIQAFAEPVDYDKNGQPYGEPAYYRRV